MNPTPKLASVLRLTATCLSVLAIAPGLIQTRAATTLSGGAANSGSPQNPAGPPPRVVGQALDQPARMLEKFGFISVSAPLLVPADKELFEFDLHRTAAKYFEEAKTEVGLQSASFEQVVQSFAFGASVQADPTVMGAYAAQLRQYYDDVARVDKKRDLVDTAAKIDYLAAVQEALKVTDPTARAQKLADAERAFSEKLSPPSTGTNAPAFPTSPANGTPGAASGLAKPATNSQGRFVNDGKFKDFLELAGKLSTKPTLPNRTALTIGAGDNAVEGIFRVLGKPGAAAAWKNKKVLFGVSTVSVNPGWRTRKDYAADASVAVRYYPREADLKIIKAVIKAKEIYPANLRKRVAIDAGLNREEIEQLDKSLMNDSVRPLKDCERINASFTNLNWVTDYPLVSAVSPLTETEVQDQAASSRRESDLAISLAGALRSAGLGGQAEAFEQFSRSRQQDVTGRAANGIVNSYSAAGLFGFQVGPRLKPIGNSAKKSARPDNLLDRQSFPVLIMMLLDESNLVPRVGWSTTSSGVSALHVYEPQIMLSVTSRWLPLTQSVHSFAETFMPWRWGQVSYREADRLTSAQTITNLIPSHPSLPNNLAFLREQMFGALANGRTELQDLPEELILSSIAESKPALQPTIPQIQDIIPASLLFTRTAAGTPPDAQTIVLMGTDLDKLDLHDGDSLTRITGGGSAKVSKAPNESAIRVTFTPDGLPEGSHTVQFQMPIDGAKAGLPNLKLTTLSPILTVKVVEPATKEAPPTGSVITGSFKEDKEGKSRELKVEISKEANEGAIRTAADLIQTEINRLKPAPAKDGGQANVSVNVQASETKGSGK